ncbi:MAG: bifunctional diaminohydroxyphosphoribosylaminopyrimidine deaminase/5-amino-6-(5-phosphoribosylamino)uracil reductase RibD [Desulfosalsimonas sp.]
MKTALELAEKGAGCTSPNPMVGAVIVHDGQIIGRGWHEKAGGPHAEVNAIADAGNRARGATMYVTLEPCNHQGRTPPCTKAILEAGISRVVCAMADPNPEVAGGGARFLADRGIDVTTGICETQARRLNEFFIHYIQTRRPFVVLKSAATLDGKIATRTGDSKWVTGPAARARVHQMRNCCDAILVGVNTVTADDPSLTTRLENTTGRDAVRVILDTRLSMPGTAKMLSQKSSAPTVIAASENADPQKAAGLEKAGARILSLPEKNDRVDLEALMEKLGQMNITSLLVEGGGRVAASFLQNRLVDKICFFYAPKILGGDGMGICSGPGPQMMSSAICITDMEIEQIGDDILIQGYIK